MEEIALIGSQLPVATRRNDESLRSAMLDIGRFVKRLELEGVARLADMTEQYARDFIDEACGREAIG